MKPRLSYPAIALGLFSACSGAHVLETDAGPTTSDTGPASFDAGPSAPSCRLASPAPAPGFAGEGCYCDGPFVVRGDVAYRQSYMLEVIDVSTPGSPLLVTSVSSQAVFAADVAVEADVLFAAGGALERFDLTDARAPVSLGVLEVGGHVEAMAIAEHRLVVSISRDDLTHALIAIDVTSPRAPVIGAASELGALDVSTIAMRGTIAFAAAMDGSGTGVSARIVALDVSDVAAPRVVGSLDANVSYLASVGVHDSRLFIGGLETGVTALDVGDPSAMRDLGVVIPASAGAQAVAVTGDVLVVSGQGLTLYDLAAPGLASLGHTDPTSDSPHAAIAGAQLLGSGGNALFSIPLDCR